MGSMLQSSAKPVRQLCILIAASIFLHLCMATQAVTEKSIDDETCLACHEGFDGILAGGPHRLASSMTNPAVSVTCVSCHEGAEGHVDDPSRETITTPAELTGRAAVEICSGCHVAHVELDNYGFDAHAVQEVNCAECHQVHGDSPALLLSDEARFCIKCHTTQVSSVMGTTNHPVLEGNVTCLSCHRFVKKVGEDLMVEIQGICGTCHPEQAGPFMYEHEAVTAYAVQGGGCMECHNPHGSHNDRLLVQPGPQVCRQCHFEPVKHGQSLAHGNAYAGYDCAICHTAVHGSFVSNLFLDPDLPSRWGIDCYATGCHSLNR